MTYENLLLPVTQPSDVTTMKGTEGTGGNERNHIWDVIVR